MDYEELPAREKTIHYLTTAQMIERCLASYETGATKNYPWIEDRKELMKKDIQTIFKRTRCRPVSWVVSWVTLHIGGGWVNNKRVLIAHTTTVPCTDKKSNLAYECWRWDSKLRKWIYQGKHTKYRCTLFFSKEHKNGL